MKCTSSDNDSTYLYSTYTHLKHLGSPLVFMQTFLIRITLTLPLKNTFEKVKKKNSHSGINLWNNPILSIVIFDTLLFF